MVAAGCFPAGPAPIYARATASLPGVALAGAAGINDTDPGQNRALHSHHPAMSGRSTIEARLAGLVLARDKPLEFTQLVGKKVSARFATADGRALHIISQESHSQYCVNITHTAVEVTFDPSMEWSTPTPLPCVDGWETEVKALLPTGVQSNEVQRAGSTRVFLFKGSTILTGDTIARILATPRVIDIRFKPGQFFILIAREHAIVGGLAHISASRKIQPRTVYRRRAARAARGARLAIAAGLGIPARRPSCGRD
jgi:hypothetical protein